MDRLDAGLIFHDAAIALAVNLKKLETTTMGRNHGKRGSWKGSGYRGNGYKESTTAKSGALKRFARCLEEWALLL